MPCSVMLRFAELPSCVKLLTGPLLELPDTSSFEEDGEEKMGGSVGKFNRGIGGCRVMMLGLNLALDIPPGDNPPALALSSMLN